VGITSHVSESKKTLTIILSDRFDFSCHGDFRDAYRSIDPTQFKITIDFTKTDYIDSAALGMLLVLRERSGSDRAKITLKGCRPSVQQILDITHFEKFFTFSD